MPDNEPEFIKKFLESLNLHVSCFFQRHLIELYPDKVRLIDLGVCQQPPSIFINLNSLGWMSVRRAVPRIKDLRALQLAFDKGICGPPESLASKQDIQTTTEERKRNISEVNSYPASILEPSFVDRDVYCTKRMFRWKKQ
jgi:hypothetical protein